MKEIKTERLLLRPFRESDYDDLFEYLSQLENDEFEGYHEIYLSDARKVTPEKLKTVIRHPIKAKGN